MTISITFPTPEHCEISQFKQIEIVKNNNYYNPL